MERSGAAWQDHPRSAAASASDLPQQRSQRELEQVRTPGAVLASWLSGQSSRQGRPAVQCSQRYLEKGSTLSGIKGMPGHAWTPKPLCCKRFRVRNVQPMWPGQGLTPGRRLHWSLAGNLSSGGNRQDRTPALAQQRRPGAHKRPHHGCQHPLCGQDCHPQWPA